MTLNAVLNQVPSLVGLVHILLDAQLPKHDPDRFSSITVGTGKSESTFDFGRTYLILEERVDKAFRITQDFVYSHSAVLCISRMHPDLLAEKWPGQKVSKIWLSERFGMDIVAPSQLSRLLQRIADFVTKNKKAVVLVDGMEYLSLFNDFLRLQQFFEQLNDLVMEHGAILLVAVDPRLFDPRSTARLRRYAEIVN